MTALTAWPRATGGRGGAIKMEQCLLGRKITIFLFRLFPGPAGRRVILVCE